MNQSSIKVLVVGGSVAQQLEFFDIPSPCRGICQTDDRGFCRGCFRSRDERFNWIKMDDGQKREVLRLCHQRLLRLKRANKQPDEPLPEQPSLF
nr:MULTISPECIES: DUF1289 domain-containing protein [Yersinia pseudotuberculosis complex]